MDELRHRVTNVQRKLSLSARVSLYIGVGVLLGGASLWHLRQGGTFRIPWPTQQSDLAKSMQDLVDRARELAYSEHNLVPDDSPLSSIHAKFREARGGAVTLNNEELNYLRATLADPKTELWDWAVILLALTGHQEEASNAVQGFIRRREAIADLPDNQQRWLLSSKATATELLGITATESDIQFLLHAITLEGAKDITKNWIDQIPPSEYDYLSPYKIYDLVQGCSGRGLAYAGSTACHEELERTYREYRQMVNAIDYRRPLTDITAHQDSVFGQLADAMALRDFVNMMPREEALYVANSCGCFLDILRTFGQKYRRDLWLER